MFATFIWILRILREASYLIFAPSPVTKKGKIGGGDALLIAKDTSAAFGWAALLVLLAKAFGADLSGEDAQKVVEAALIVWPIVVAIVSTIVRWFQESRPKPLPSPPPNPKPYPDGIRHGLAAIDDSIQINKVHVSVKRDPESDGSGTIFGRYDFEIRPPGGGPNGPKN